VNPDNPLRIWTIGDRITASIRLFVWIGGRASQATLELAIDAPYPRFRDALAEGI
jgi:hypothetical protein